MNKETLIQMQEEKEMVERLGDDFFRKIDKSEAVSMPEDMTVNEYKQWRKQLKEFVN